MPEKLLKLQVKLGSIIRQARSSYPSYIEEEIIRYYDLASRYRLRVGGVLPAAGDLIRRALRGEVIDLDFGELGLSLEVVDSLEMVS